MRNQFQEQTSRNDSRVAESEVKCPTFLKFPTPAFIKFQAPTPEHNMNEVWL